MLEQKLELESPHEEPMSNPENHFAADYQQANKVLDINNPPRKNYNPHAPENQYPKMMYHHDSSHTLIVESALEQKAAEKKGFRTDASTKYDYSKARPGRMTPLAVTADREESVDLSDDDIAALDAGEEENAEAYAEAQAAQDEASKPARKGRRG